MVTEQPGAIGDTAAGEGVRCLGDLRGILRARAAGALAIVTAVLVLAPAPAFARDLTRVEVASRVAGPSGEAAAGLSDVTTFEGAPIDIAQLTDGASPSQVVARLTTLSSTATAGATVDSSEARTRAGRILDRAIYQATPAQGDDPGTSWFSGRDLGIPRYALLLLFATAGGLLAWRLGRTRLAELARSADEHQGRSRPERAEDIERRAAEAEGRGDFAGALRLLFDAGLCRLEERGVLDSATPMTTNQLRRRVGSTVFDRLAGRFEQIVYGGDPAQPGDVKDARAGWAALTERTGR